MFTLGRFVVDTTVVKIPYLNIILSLLFITIPTIIGLLIRRYRVPLADKIAKKVKPMCAFGLLYLATFGIYANLFMFKMMFRYAAVIPACGLLSWTGFLLGFLIALMLHLPIDSAKTIGLETGFQNANIAIIILMYSLPQPEGDIGSVMPVAAFFAAPFPLYVILAVMYVRKCLAKPTEEEKDGEKGATDSSKVSDEIEEGKAACTAQEKNDPDGKVNASKKIKWCPTVN